LFQRLFIFFIFKQKFEALKKTVFLYFFFLAITAGTAAQFSSQLCKANETVAFAFQLKNQKWVSVCRDKNDAYLVYRFGTKNKIELSYPAVLDSTSWQQFTYKYYSRGGGIQNAAMHIAFLSFSNNNADYELYDTWTAEENVQRCGVSVTVNNKTSDLKGLLKTRKQYLQSLTGSPVKTEEGL
jgi:hypothetical protein